MIQGGIMTRSFKALSRRSAAGQIFLGGKTEERRGATSVTRPAARQQQRDNGPKAPPLKRRNGARRRRRAHAAFNGPLSCGTNTLLSLDCRTHVFTAARRGYPTGAGRISHLPGSTTRWQKVKFHVCVCVHDCFVCLFTHRH